MLTDQYRVEAECLAMEVNDLRTQLHEARENETIATEKAEATKKEYLPILAYDHFRLRKYSSHSSHQSTVFQDMTNSRTGTLQ